MAPISKYALVVEVGLKAYRPEPAAIAVPATPPLFGVTAIRPFQGELIVNAPAVAIFAPLDFPEFITSYDGRIPRVDIDGDVWFTLPTDKIDFSQLTKIG